MRQGQLAQQPPLFKLIILFSAIILSGGITTLLMGAIAQPLFNVDLSTVDAMMDNIAFMQTYQIVQSISLFVIPSLLAFFLFFKSFKIGINGTNHTNAVVIVITLGIIFFGQFFITYSAWLNHQIQLPDSMQNIYKWLVAKEAEAGELTKYMLRSDNWGQITVTLLMMSILPALGEEWLFRGVLQRKLIQIFSNKHIAIAVTAIIFSAIHMQFLTFLPRFFLGIMLGYLFVYSGNLWTAVIAHFANNFMAIMAYMFVNKDDLSAIDVPTENPFGFGVIISAFVIVAGLYFIKTLNTHKNSFSKHY